MVDIPPVAIIGISKCEKSLTISRVLVNKCGPESPPPFIEKLYSEKKDQGFMVLGFPSHDFYQEPAPEQDIKDFCNLTYDVKFPMFTKTKVRGKDAHPFFKLLTKETNSSPKWNFHKYLIGKDGTIIDSFATVTGPGSNRIIKKIDELLNSSS